MRRGSVQRETHTDILLSDRFFFVIDYYRSTTFSGIPRSSPRSTSRYNQRREEDNEAIGQEDGHLRGGPVI